MDINWSIPQKRTRKVEKYEDKAVITMCIVPLSKGVRKFTLNKKAIETLGFDLDGLDSIVLGFSNGNIYCANSKNLKVDTAYSIAKQGSFSNAKLYTYVQDYLNLDVSRENDFELIPSDQESVFKMQIIKQEAAKEETSEAKEEQVEELTQ